MAVSAIDNDMLVHKEAGVNVTTRLRVTDTPSAIRHGGLESERWVAGGPILPNVLRVDQSRPPRGIHAEVPPIAYSFWLECRPMAKRSLAAGAVATPTPGSAQPQPAFKRRDSAYLVVLYGATKPPRLLVPGAAFEAALGSILQLGYRDPTGRVRT